MRAIVGILLLSLLSLPILGCSSNSKPTPVASLTPEQIEQNLAEAGALRSEHALLNKLAGNWNVETKIWMDPTQRPEITYGRASAKLIYGGRYLVQNYKGSFMGRPFEGQGMMGFDNLSERYFSTWVDSVSTMLMTSKGSAVGDNTIILSSAMTCPLTREHMEGEEVITMLDKYHYRFEAFQKRDGKRVKMMEIAYARVG